MLTSDQISEKLYCWLSKLPPEKMLDGLLEALDSMQGYNGNSVTHVICEAFNFPRKDKGDGNYAWVYPAPEPEPAPTPKKRLKQYHISFSHHASGYCEKHNGTVTVEACNKLDAELLFKKLHPTWCCWTFVDKPIKPKKVKK